MRIIRLASILLPLGLAVSCSPATGPRPDPGPVIERSEILWDTWGVPHVYGRTVEDVGYGYGWAQAQAHADAILRLYGLVRGRGAEYWGAQNAPSDRIARTMGIPDAGREGYEAQEGEFRRYLDAFAEGINAYARAHPDAIADSLQAVLPVTGADVMAHGQRHPEIGATIMERSSFLRPGLPAVLHHQERSDGSGYPYGLRGDAISLQGRIVAVVDTYDAIVSSRPYRNGSTCEHALAEIRRNSGSQFDPAVVEAFLRASANGFPDDPDTPRLPERVEAAAG